MATVSGLTVDIVGSAKTIERWRALSPFPAVAHRGGPNVTARSEFSVDGYDNAIAVDPAVAFEASWQRTVDGVWVLNHDADTDDQYTTNLTIATSTLTALQALTRRYGVTSEPIVTLAEFFARYPDRVVFAENKTYGDWAAWYTAIETAAGAGWQDRIVFKAHWTADTEMAEAKGRGYTTWAYCNGDTQAADAITGWNPSTMDWIGFSTGGLGEATQARYDWAATNDVPVVGHVAYTGGNWTTLRGHGAQMGMVNNPALLPLT